MKTLLDANLLVALLVDDHVHHDRAEQWLSDLDGEFASCPITEGALIRIVLQGGGTVVGALESLGSLRTNHRFEFWPDDLPYGSVDMTGVIGHRQVSDAYLAGLARSREGSLATFDRGLVALHPDVAMLVAG